MPNSRHSSVIASPSSNLATNRRRSSITEHSFHGIDTSRSKAERVTHVSGTLGYLCLGPLIPQVTVLAILSFPFCRPLIDFYPQGFDFDAGACSEVGPRNPRSEWNALTATIR